MKSIFIIIFSVLVTLINAQEIDSTDATLNFVNYLYEKGVDKKDGILFISDDSKNAINDTIFRKMLYPKEYTWDKANFLINKNLLKQAFWHIINLYDLNQESKEMAVRIVLAYNKLFDMEKVLTGTFYSYAFMDEEIGGLIDGKITIDHPNVLEDKLRKVNELIQYIRTE